MKPLLALGLFGAAFALPCSAGAQCSYTMNPTVTLAEDGPANALTGLPSLQAHWAINCTGQCRPDWQEGGHIDPFYAAVPNTQADPGCADPGDKIGAGVCTFNVVGKKVVGKIPDPICGDPFQGSTVVVGVSAPYVVAPWVPPDVNHGLGVLPDFNDPAYLQSNFSGDPNQVPVGVRFKVEGGTVTPAGTEVATFHVEGAGISFSKSYPAHSPPKDVEGDWVGDNDPSSFVKATTPGTFQYWIEFEGTTSQKVTLTAVAGGNAGAGGGGGGSENAGGGSVAHKAGCNATGAESGLVLLALVALGLSRRRTAARA